MSITLIDTAGAADANTYVSLENAEAYFVTRPFASAWTSQADDEVKKQALVFATQLLDRQKWAGSKGMTTASATTQALAWPRTWAPTLEFDAAPEIVSEYFIDLSVAFYSSLTIPQPIVRATCELALALLAAGSVDPFAAETKRVKSKTTGPLSTVYFDSQDQIKGLGRFPHVIALVAPVLRTATDGVEVIRG